MASSSSFWKTRDAAGFPDQRRLHGSHHDQERLGVAEDTEGTGEAVLALRSVVDSLVVSSEPRGVVVFPHSLQVSARRLSRRHR
jgi:hypothetical protein